MIEDNQMEKISRELKEYVEVSYELAKLQSIGKVATIGADLLSGIFIITLSLLSTLFASFWIANCISDYLNWENIGLAIVSGFYFILYILFILLKKKILLIPLRDKLLRKLTVKD